MADIFHMMFPNAFSWMKMYKSRVRFNWSLFPMVHLTISQHWFRQWLGAGQVTSHYLNQWWLMFWRMCASLGLNELNFSIYHTVGSVALHEYCVISRLVCQWRFIHDDVIKWKHFPRHWPFVRVIHRSPVNYPHNGQWRGALMFSLICAWIKG